MSIFESYQQRFDQHLQEEYSLQEYLELCKQDPLVYATAAERMLAAIGEPELVDTSQDSRLSRIFSNKLIARYPAFSEFYGMEEAIEQIVSYFKHAAQGLEEKKQILYLLGPVGGGKSSLADRLKVLMEKMPIYAIKDSPVFESPLGLFDVNEDGEILEQDYGIARRYLTKIMSPWAVKRLNEYGGDITKFKVVKIQPSILNQVAIAKTEPGDENNQDISALVGKVDIRMLEHYAQNDADAYSYSGALCRANQGLMEFVEMFKAPIKVLHPLLTATQEGNYNGTEGLSALPFEGTILAHSNESEWQSFRNNKNNEAFLDRVYIVKVPYCLRVSEEINIYDKLLYNSSLSEAPCAPSTLEMLAQFSVLSRLVTPENSSIYSKMKVYDGESLKDTDPKAKSYQEYRDYAGVDEGMRGLSTRFAFKILSRVFNFDSTCSSNRLRVNSSRRTCTTATSSISRASWCLTMSNSSVRKSRPLTSNPTRSTARIFSTVTSPMPTSGFRTRSTAIPKPAKTSAERRSTKSSRKSKNRPVSPIPRIFVTRSLISC
jgi:serine protein kinase